MKIYKEFTRLTLTEYLHATVTSYTGGATWMRLGNRTLVVGGKAPIDILNDLKYGREVHAEIYTA